MWPVVEKTHSHGVETGCICDMVCELVSSLGLDAFQGIRTLGRSYCWTTSSRIFRERFYQMILHCVIWFSLSPSFLSSMTYTVTNGLPKNVNLIFIYCNTLVLNIQVSSLQRRTSSSSPTTTQQQRLPSITEIQLSIWFGPCLCFSKMCYAGCFMLHYSFETASLILTLEVFIVLNGWYIYLDRTGSCI